jgi:hypothetical protein
MAETLVLAALNRKYAQLKGHLERHQREAAKVRRSMLHVEATIRLFREDYKVSDIAPIIPNKAIRWRSKGIGIRLALNILKEATEPLTTNELARLTMDRGGIPTEDARVVNDVGASLHNSLKRRVGKDIVLVEGHPKRWLLTPRAANTLPIGGSGVNS